MVDLESRDETDKFDFYSSGFRGGADKFDYGGVCRQSTREETVKFGIGKVETRGRTVKFDLRAFVENGSLGNSRGDR